MIGNRPPNLLRAIIPLAIGLTVVGALLYQTVEENGGWDAVQGSVTLPGWPLATACLAGLILIRDLGYVLRLRWLSNGSLTWRAAIETTVVWEFASAITPGIVGGGAVAFDLVGSKQHPRVPIKLSPIVGADHGGLPKNCNHSLLEGRGHRGTGLVKQQGQDTELAEAANGR